MTNMKIVFSALLTALVLARPGPGPGLGWDAEED